MKTTRSIAFTALALMSATASFAASFQDHLGIQVWSVRETAKNDLPGSLDLIKKWGFVEIEANGAPPVPIEEYNKLIKDRGFKAVSAHFGYEMLATDIATVIKNAKVLGLKYAGCAWIPHGKEGMTAELAHKAAADFNKAGAALRAEGIKLAWHPHGFEFAPIASEGGKSAFEIIMAEAKPENLTLQMDVFWVFHAGKDPVEMLKKYSGRWETMHVKDIRKGAVTGLSTGSAAPIDNVTVGTGQIDWPAVLKAAERNGTKYFFIEDETPTPLVCIPESLKYLRALKL